MGTRGNVIMKRGGALELIPLRMWAPIMWLVEGPDSYEDRVRAAITDLDLVRIELYHDVQCEGAVFVDHDARQLVFQADCDWTDSLAARRRFSELVRLAWPGWTTRWASHGFAEVLEASGFDVASYKYELFDEWSPIHNLDWLLCDSETAGVVTVRSAGRQWHVPVSCDPTVSDLRPENLRAWLDSSEGVSSERLELDAQYDPEGGMMLDLDARSIALWSIFQPSMGGFEDRWPGWSVTLWGDRFESHLEAAGGTLRFPARSDAECAEAVFQLLQRGGPLRFPPLVEAALGETVERLRREEEARLTPRPLPQNWKLYDPVSDAGSVDGSGPPAGWSWWVW